jgi:dTDP-glucose 4,6-dehydratase
MRVLVTGGAGFIASEIARQYVAAGDTVAIADKFSYAGKGRNISDILPQVDLLIGNLATGDLAQRCADWGPEIVIHAAGDTHVDKAIEDPFRFQINNVLGTCSLLEALRQMHRPPRAIVVYSTDEVFGPTPQGEAFGEDSKHIPSNAYSASKCGVEGLATAFYVTHGLPTIIVRPCNTYGPRQHPEKVIPKFVGQILSGRAVTLYNDGRGARDWLHVVDHGRAVRLVAAKGEPGTSYNLAANEEHSDSDILARIEASLREAGHIHRNTVVPIEATPGRAGHDRRYMMDGSRIRALGWRPEVNFMKGFSATVLWNAENRTYWDSDVVRLSGDGLPCG